MVQLEAQNLNSVLGAPSLSWVELLLFSFQETWYWKGNSDAAEVVLSGVRCKGTELSLLQCQHHGPVHCPTGGGRFAAGVTCTSSEWK